MRNKIINLKTYLNRLVRGNERGVALIFTLGILGLLMVIALAFASTSMVERKVASNVNSSQVAKFLAKSALERIEAGLAEGTLSLDKLVSGDHSSTNKETYDWLWKLETVDSGVTVYELPDTYVATSAICPTWQYVKNGNEIIGRFAYVVVQDGGKLDPSEVTDTTASPKYRLGVSVGEIDIKNLDTADANYQNYDATLVAGLSSLGITRWADFNQIFSTVSIADKNKFAGFFQIRNTPDPEAFWLDINNNGKADTSETFHRFNMVRTDWNTVTVEDICPTAGADSEVAKKYSETLADLNVTGGIPWIRSWTDATGSSGSATITKKQIAANLIQYNSLDTRDVISDILVANWLTNADANKPEYTGLKRTPYINEVCADVEVKVSVMTTRDERGTGGTADFTVTFSALVKLGGELINMYGANLLGGTYPLYLFGQLEVTPVLNGADQVPSTLLLNNAAAPYKSLSFTLDGADAYTPVGEITPLAFSDASSNGGAYTDLLTVNLLNQNADPTAAARGSLTLSRAVLGTIDYAKIQKTTALPQQNLASGAAYTYAVSYQTKDPRQNLNSGDWTASIGAPTKGVVNTGASPALGNDAETATDPAYLGAGSGQHVSTAYIRHGTMRSPWEIGNIHRGSAWNTLNLNKHASRSGATILNGGGVYSDGDANILDQVKFTNSTTTYGKVNLNTNGEKSDGILNALFAQIPYREADVSASESKYHDPGNSAVFSSQNQSAAVAAFKTLRNTFTSSTLKTRTEFLNNSAQFNDFIGKLYDNSALARVTDAQKEQIVCKFINLTKAERIDQARLIILAQSIKEAPVNTVIYKDWNNSGNLAQNSDATDIGKINSGYLPYNKTVTFATIPSLASKITTPATLGTYNNGADQITGESKMIITVVRDMSTGKWKTQRVEYAE